MNWLLICVIGILVVCALEGYFRGFIKIVFSLLAMIITLAVVPVAAPKITTYIEENTELDERITEKCLEHVEKMRRTGWTGKHRRSPKRPDSS